MAFENIDPLLSIWRDKGFNFLFMPDGWNRTKSAQKGAAKPEYAKKKLGHDPRNQEIRPETQPAKKPEFSERKNVVQSGVSKPVPARIPVADWPHAWKEELGFARKGVLAWTYPDLGKDLAAGRLARQNREVSPSPERERRGQFLRGLFKNMAYPAGIHTFWPASLTRDPDSGVTDDKPNIEIFWTGLERLGCSGLVIMGPKLAEILLETRNPSPLTCVRKRGQSVWILRDIETYLDGNSEYKAMLAFLRRSLSIIANKLPRTNR